jgi:16S rRNA (cytosine1402-N4)-methyltransferase
MSDSSSQPQPHKRRPRYRGRNPSRFEDKYKERDPGRYAETVAKVLASGKTPAGTHRPIMVREILDALTPAPGEIAVDATLGYGGHAEALAPRLQPGGRLLGLDIDPIELPRTEARLRARALGSEIFTAIRSNFAGLPQVLARAGLAGADLVLADLGVSSMQLDDPARGFSMKREGPLDMRMNPRRGQPASVLIERSGVDALASLFAEHADEPHAAAVATALAGRAFETTTALAAAIRQSLGRADADQAERSVRRVFQALRIAVNEELSALDMFLRRLPACLNPGGRVAILTFHSGEDRRVKTSFEAALRAEVYAAIAPEPIRPGADERRANPRATPAKLRWARAPGSSPAGRAAGPMPRPIPK